MRYLPAAIILTAITLAAGGSLIAQGGSNMEMTSPAFKNNGYIPAKYTCEGEDINPELVIRDAPQAAKSLALIMDDPDAPIGVWVHWVVFDIPVTSRVEENSVPGKLGITNSGKRGYHGPCPPSGTHRYFFKVYALDTLLDLKEDISKGQLQQAMQGHILDKSELIGLYQRH